MYKVTGKQCVSNMGAVKSALKSVDKSIECKTAELERRLPGEGNLFNALSLEINDRVSKLEIEGHASTSTNDSVMEAYILDVATCVLKEHSEELKGMFPMKLIRMPEASRRLGPTIRQEDIIFELYSSNVLAVCSTSELFDSRKKLEKLKVVSKDLANLLRRLENTKGEYCCILNEREFHYMTTAVTIKG